jgi:hypothetical protein
MLGNAHVLLYLHRDWWEPAMHGIFETLYFTKEDTFHFSDRNLNSGWFRLQSEEIRSMVRWMKGRNIGHTLYRRTSICFLFDKKDKEKIMDMEHWSWHYWKMKLSQFKHMRLLILWKSWSKMSFILIRILGLFHLAFSVSVSASPERKKWIKGSIKPRERTVYALLSCQWDHIPSSMLNLWTKQFNYRKHWQFIYKNRRCS